MQLSKSVDEYIARAYRNIEGYSTLRLGVILAIFCYMDMITTFIGLNMGMFEMNEIIYYMFNINPYIIFLYPVFILFVVYIFYRLLYRWEFAIKVGFILLSFQFFMASATNIMGMFM